LHTIHHGVDNNIGSISAQILALQTSIGIIAGTAGILISASDLLESASKTIKKLNLKTEIKQIKRKLKADEDSICKISPYFRLELQVKQKALEMGVKILKKEVPDDLLHAIFSGTGAGIIFAKSIVGQTAQEVTKITLGQIFGPIGGAISIAEGVESMIEHIQEFNKIQIKIITLRNLEIDEKLKENVKTILEEIKQVRIDNLKSYQSVKSITGGVEELLKIGAGISTAVAPAAPAAYIGSACCLATKCALAIGVETYYQRRNIQRFARRESVPVIERFEAQWKMDTLDRKIERDLSRLENTLYKDVGNCRYHVIHPTHGDVEDPSRQQDIFRTDTKHMMMRVDSKLFKLAEQKEIAETAKLKVIEDIVIHRAKRSKKEIVRELIAQLKHFSNDDFLSLKQQLKKHFNFELTAEMGDTHELTLQVLRYIKS